MSKRPLIVFGLLAAICLVAIPIYALGKEGAEDAGHVEVASRDQAAKQVFQNNCGWCHTLAAAGTDGIVGPDLDGLLIPTGTNSADQYEGLYGRVLLAVSCGRAGRMPKGIVVGEEAQDVSAFVAAYAGQIGSGPTVDTAEVEKPEPQDCPDATG
jgi:mono/diheme cytochrome c family protein